MYKMDLQSFFEKFIIRDILAILLPGGLILLGLSFFTKGDDVSTDGIISELNKLEGWVSVVFLLFASFILGHFVDLIYRYLFQSHECYKCDNVVKKQLTKQHIKDALNEFWTSNSPKTMDNITEEEFRENTFVLRYWIELRNKELYDSEIENVAIKAHFLVASGISIILFGLCCIAFISASLEGSIILIGCLTTFGAATISQGFHHRKVLTEHIYRVFYVLWRQRSSDINNANSDA